MLLQTAVTAARRRALPALTLAAAVGLSTAVLPPPARAQAAELRLYRSFELPSPGTWAEVVLPLAPAGWRVGAPDGPPASAADLARWRAAPGLVAVLGRCSGAQSGSTHHPCAFDLAPPLPDDAQPLELLAALTVWQTTSDDRLARFDHAQVQAASIARGGLGARAALLLQALLPDDRQLLGFYAPGLALRPAAGAAVLPTLRLRAVDNPLTQAQFASHGLAVLSTRAVPWPSLAPATPRGGDAL